MNKSRVEAFSDGVIAIIITIVVLLFDLPEGDDWGSLAKILPLFFYYAVSFVLLAMSTLWIIPDLRMKKFYDKSKDD